VPVPSSRGEHPEWEFDELVLSLDLYISQEHLDADPAWDATDPHVLAFSELLQTLGLGGPGGDRSPRAVVRMLERWRAVDGEWNFAPSPRGAPRETAVWRRFLTSHMSDDGLSVDDTELSAAARGIRALSDAGSGSPPAVDGEDEAVEGRLLFRLHAQRERDPDITRRKKEVELERLGRLACEVCAFDFAATYGQLGEGFIECHHRLPLSTSGERKTRLSDLALVCPNCHRMLHRSRTTLSVEELAALLLRGGSDSGARS
jgi:5-methylcytosine-specific restriction protein A